MTSATTVVCSGMTLQGHGSDGRPKHAPDFCVQQASKSWCRSILRTKSSVWLCILMCSTASSHSVDQPPCIPASLHVHIYIFLSIGGVFNLQNMFTIINQFVAHQLSFAAIVALENLKAVRIHGDMLMTVSKFWTIVPLHSTAIS